jgi:hypothetical protein
MFMLKKLGLVGVALAVSLAVCAGVVVPAKTSHGAQRGHPKSQKFDEFGYINREELKARLDNFAVGIQVEPDAEAYIKFHSGRRLPPSEVQATADYAKNYLVRQRRIDAGRIVTVDAGPNRNSSVEFWIVPRGAAPPE